MTKTKRVLMLATTAAMIEQFNKPNIEILNDLGYKVDMIGNFDEGNPIPKEQLDEFRVWMKDRGGRCYNYSATRNPLDAKNNVEAYKKTVRLINKKKYAFIHCHTPLGAVIGRFAAHKTHTKIIYTAHGFHFYKGAPAKNWMLYYPVEKFLSKWTDILITINKEDYGLAKRNFHAGKVVYIPGVGVDLSKFERKLGVREKKRNELGVKEEDIVIISVGELIERKNHKMVIEAIADLKDSPIFDQLHYFICGQGPLMDELSGLVKKLNVGGHVHLLGFREDIADLCNASDIFAFMSYQEGLSVALMEAMACGLPVICSRIRGNTDLIEDGENGVFANLDAADIADKIAELSNNADERKRLGMKAEEKIQEFDVHLIERRMADVYKSIIE